MDKETGEKISVAAGGLLGPTVSVAMKGPIVQCVLGGVITGTAVSAAGVLLSRRLLSEGGERSR